MDTLNFLKNYLSLFLYGLALTLSIIRYSKYFDSILKYLPILIGYTLLTELLGLLIKNEEDFIIVLSNGFSYYNSLIYNIFDFFFYLYFFYIYWNILKDKKHKKWVKNSGLMFLVVSVVNPFFQDFYLIPQIYAMIAGSTFLTLFAFLYIKQLKSSKMKSYQASNLMFWISIGLLVFYPIYPIIFIIVVYLDNSIYQSLHVGSIHQFLICLMYTCFIIGFIKMRKLKPLLN